METKQAYGIEELAKAGPLRRTYLYQAIKAKKLIAQKAGRRTFVTRKNFLVFLRSFPVVGERLLGGAVVEAQIAERPQILEVERLHVAGQERPDAGGHVRTVDDEWIR